MQAGRMGSLLQWNLTAGVFLLIGFTSALEGPKEKAGFLGRPLSLMCTYSKGYKDNVKYWCQGNNWGSCIIVVKTDGTEAEVKAGRTFIKDNQTSFQFTVTLEKLTEEDAGTYWCGIEIGGRDYGFPVTIIVLPGFTSALKGPEVVAGFLGRPLSLMCTYSKDYKDYVKYWCQGNNWDSCTIVVKTDGTEAEAKAGRTFIKDNQTSFQFTVTLEKLTEEDAGTYWCGIEIVGRDFGFRVTITVLPGCWALNGPNKVNSYVGGSLSVCCHYDKDYESNSKYWCKFQKMIPIIPSMHCTVLVKSELDKKVKDSRISIQDNEENLYFQVIMDNLTLEDTGHYQCGIRRFPRFALTHDVEVTVYSAPILDPEEGSTITEPPGRLSTTEQEERLPATEKPESENFAENTDEFNASPRPTPPDSEESKVQILIYCMVPLFSLLLLAAVVFVALSRKRRTGSCLQRKEEMNMSVMVSTHNTEDAHIEDTILDHPPDAEGTGLYRIIEVQPEHNYDAVEKRDKDPYITLGLSDAQEQIIYDNVSLPSQATLQLPFQEALYAKINKKPAQKQHALDSAKFQT
ncbi:hypothetical protein JD844_011529 [Phrynosoma platyrhinos]|uniref:Ig-like domain-containing protein n=1 Tax=Phrynosoma platyrhinos TaxID=52577 RepID=A0ABQ7TI58_PHRPL|nr:hypothetical protein JD844_011529 [Phrynosoma platyrhinos]